MNGILIIAHAPLAHALRSCAVHVFPDCEEALAAIDVQPNLPPEETLAIYAHLNRLIVQADVDMIFQQLASLTQLKAPKRLLLAPFSLHKRMVLDIQRVAEAAAQGLVRRGVAKVVMDEHTIDDDAKPLLVYREQKAKA